MKILHLSTHDVSGGAAKAATRLHKQLCRDGIESTMVVADKAGHDPRTIALHTSAGYSIRRNLNLLPLRMVDLNAIIMPNVSWLPNPKLSIVNRINPDVIHLHWAQNGFVPLHWLRKVSKPIVWTFHDMWPFCGALHHEFEDHPRFREPYTRENRPPHQKGFDIDAWVWRQKKAVYENAEIAAVAPSRWLAEKARESYLWRNRAIDVIPNGLDTGVFKPMDREFARDLFNLPQDKTIILFGAMFARDDINKGYAKLRAALDELKLPRESVHLAIFGMETPSQPEILPYPVSYLGYLKDEASMAAVYAAADVAVVPSLQESFGQTASEPMACGRPVVAFNTSGLKDVVDHQINGYLADPYDPADLARGIRWVVSEKQRWHALSFAAREKAVNEFSARGVAARHLRLYRQLAGKDRSLSGAPFVGVGRV